MGHWCTDFVGGRPFCRKPALKTSTGPHPFFNHQQTHCFLRLLSEGNTYAVVSKMITTKNTVQQSQTYAIDSAEGASTEHNALSQFRLVGDTQHGCVRLNARRVERLELYIHHSQVHNHFSMLTLLQHIL